MGFRRARDFWAGVREKVAAEAILGKSKVIACHPLFSRILGKLGLLKPEMLIFGKNLLERGSCAFFGMGECMVIY